MITGLNMQAGRQTHALLSKQTDLLSVFAAQNQPVCLFVAVFMRKVWLACTVAKLSIF